MTLNQIVEKYLYLNGIKKEFYAEYIGAVPSKCTKWLKGEQKLTKRQLAKTHEFLAGKHIKTVGEIMKGGE